MAPLLALPSLSLFDEIAKYVTKKFADGRDKSGDPRLTFLQLPGACGTVYRSGWTFPRTLEEGVTVDVNVDVAVKILKETEELAVQDFIREAHLWVRVPPHPNVLPLVGIYFQDKDRLRGLVSPFATGVLWRWLKEPRTYVERFKLVCDIAEGLKHLHKNGVVQGDLSVVGFHFWKHIYCSEYRYFGQSILEIYRAEDPHVHLLSQPARTSPGRRRPTKEIDVREFGHLMQQVKAYLGTGPA